VRLYVFLALLLFVTIGLLVASLSDIFDRADTSKQEDVAPSDPTLYLTVPRLGIYDHTVRNDASESALSMGAIKLPDTDFPWQEGDKNTYIACHRLGYPNTESYYQCLDLPMMQQGDEITLKDANGEVYEYRVSEFLQVAPTDRWVTERSEGRQIVSLQTCIENYNDFYTLGPNWLVRYIVWADQVS
jgi:sortase A